MRDVAIAAGVSQSTVSHVLNGTRHVEPTTANAVRQAIEQTGYVNDGVARSLRTGYTRTIGVAISAISNMYFIEVVGAIEQALYAADHMMLLAETHDDPKREVQVVRALASRGVDGVILAPSADPTQALAVLKAKKIPVVLIDRTPPDLAHVVDSVAAHNVEPTAALVDHLVTNGHRRIGFLGGREGLSTTTERLEGFRLGLHRNNVAVDDALIFVNQSDSASTHRTVQDLIRSTDPPSALVIGNNMTTVGVLKTLRDLHIKIPDDLAIAAFDDLPWAALISPSLTVVAQPVAELGATAVRVLFQRLAKPNRAIVDIRLDPQLVIRDSGRPTNNRRNRHKASTT